MVRRRREEEDDDDELEDEEDDEEEEEDDDDDRVKLREIHGWLSELMAGEKQKNNRPASSRGERRDSGRRKKRKVQVQDSQKTKPANIKSLRGLFQKRSG